MGVIRSPPPLQRFSNRLRIKDQALACKQLWVSYLLTFHNNNQVLIKNCCYGNGRFTTCPPYWPPSWIFRKFCFAANFTAISKKHVFAASNRNIIKNRIFFKKIRTNFLKNLQFSISSFNLHNILRINYKWWRHPINFKRCAHYKTTGTEIFILIAWKLQILGPKDLLGVPLFGVRGLSLVHSCAMSITASVRILNNKGKEKWIQVFHEMEQARISNRLFLCCINFLCLCFICLSHKCEQGFMAPFVLGWLFIERRNSFCGFIGELQDEVIPSDKKFTPLAPSVFFFFWSAVQFTWNFHSGEGCLRGIVHPPGCRFICPGSGCCKTFNRDFFIKKHPIYQSFIEVYSKETQLRKSEKNNPNQSSRK